MHDPDEDRTTMSFVQHSFLPLAYPPRDKRFAQTLQGTLSNPKEPYKGLLNEEADDDTARRDTGAVVRKCLAFRVPSSPRIVVPAHAKWQRSSIMFGLSTTADNVLKNMPVWDHWLPKSNRPLVDAQGRDAATLPLVLALAPPPNPTERARMTEAVEEAQARGMNVDIKKRNAQKPEARYFALVQEMWQEAIKRQARLGVQTEWFAIIDDDTFFPEWEAIPRMLARHDSSRDVLLGGLSVCKKQVQQHGRIAFGGAGIFISRSLMAKMNAPGAWDECLDSFGTLPSISGDGIVSRCAAHAVQLDLEHAITFVPELTQLDIRGDATGWFQSSPRVASFQHWNSWFTMFPPWHPTGQRDLRQSVQLAGRAAVGVGGDNWLRRYVFDQGKVVVVLGYSVTVYQEAHDSDEYWQGSVEHTWWEHELRDRPTRGPLEEGREKRTYYLTGVRLVEPGVVKLEHKNKELERVDIVFDNRAGHGRWR